MPIQTPQWTEYLSCPVCENGFELEIRLPISLGCGHTICKTCLSNLQRSQCPFDLCCINIPLDKLPVNTALVLLIDSEASLDEYRNEYDTTSTKKDETGGINEEESATNYDDKNGAPIPPGSKEEKQYYKEAMGHMEKLAVFLRPSNNQQMSRPMQRKLVTLINCQPLEEEGRARAVRAARSLGERSVTELILQHQNPQQLSANLWAAVRTRGCQFLGPAMQEEVLKLVLLALEDGSALSRKVLVMFVVQKLEPSFPQASKTSIGHVVQLLYRASCFKVTKRDGDSSLMQLKEEFRTYETLRREHDAQIVQIATEAGLRIAPDQWSSLLYGDTTHKSHMQSIIDKLQTPQSFLQSVQELVIALQRTGDPGKLAALRPHLDLLSGLDPNPENMCSEWSLLKDSLHASEQVVAGLLTFMGQHSNNRRGGSGNSTNGSSILCNSERSGPGLETGSVSGGVVHHNSRYKTSMCRDLSLHGSCPRGKNCTFAHSPAEMDQFRTRNMRQSLPITNTTNDNINGNGAGDISSASSIRGMSPRGSTPHLHMQQHPLNTTQKSLSPQPQQHPPPAPPPSNNVGMMTGAVPHRMTSPSPNMRVPPLMSAVNPMTAPVAQVAPVPRGYDHGQSQSHSQMVSLVRYSTPGVPPPPTPSQQQQEQQTHPHPPPAQPTLLNPEAVAALAAAGPPPAIPPNHGGPPPAHLVGHPQVGIPPQIQVHYPTIFQATLMPQQGQQQLDQIDQVPVPDQQQIHQQVYHYQQDIQIQQKTPEALKDDDAKPNFPPTTAQTAKVATKSLSALKSRKEEIIDSLQDIVGKEETKKISVRTAERAASSVVQSAPALKQVEAVQSVHQAAHQVQSNQQTAQNVDSSSEAGQDYSLWTSKAFTPFVNEECINQDEETEDDASEESKISYSITHSISDELIPFSDGPQISRFGPISRKGMTSMRNKASQSQAVMDDQPLTTPVLSNSKQMSRPAPTLPTAFLHQNNGTFMALQPVAVGANGEIGYIAVQQPTPDTAMAAAAGTELNLMDLDNAKYMNNMFAPTAQSPSHNTAPISRNNPLSTMTAGGAFNGNELGPHSQEALRLESERMKHELEVLQQKISCLNTARMASTSGGSNGSSSGGAVQSLGASHLATNDVTQTETVQLTSELQLIENTIKDREREISVNRNTDMTATGSARENATEGTTNLDYGSYIAHGLMSDAADSGRSQSITTTAGSGHVPRTNGNYFDRN